MMVGSVRCLTTRCWRVVAACVSLAGVVAGCTSSPIPLEMAPGADAYVVAVRDDVAMVVAVKVSEARVVPTTRLAGDGQEIIQSELVGGDAESSVLAVVRRNAATDIIRVSEAGSRTEVLKAGLNTGLVASDGVHVAWLTPAAGGAGHQLHLASDSWEGVADLDFAPTHLDVGDGTVVSASSESGELRAERRDGELRLVSQASWRAPRPLVVEVAPTASVVVAGEADSLGQASADLASFDLIPTDPTSTVADLTGRWLAYDLTDGARQSVVVQERGTGHSYRVPVPEGEPLLGVHVTDEGKLALLQPSRVTFADAEGPPLSVELPGETDTLWR